MRRRNNHDNVKTKKEDESLAMVGVQAIVPPCINVTPRFELFLSYHNWKRLVDNPSCHFLLELGRIFLDRNLGEDLEYLGDESERLRELCFFFFCSIERALFHTLRNERGTEKREEMD